jgi:thiamine biosynthesis lipoprotein
MLVDVVIDHELCLATSGSDRRGDHILREGRPAAGVLSATVLGPDLARADAYATAAVALGADAPPLLAELDADGFPSLVVRADGTVEASPGWPGLHQRPRALEAVR